MMTSIRSAERSKSQCASIISSALFIIDALSMVTFCPIDHVGCFNASARVAQAIVSRVALRNGPPLAVKTIRSTSVDWSPDRRHCKMALCSLSTGRIETPFLRAASVTIAPAATSVSLFASAISHPASIAAKIGAIPAAPTIAPITKSPRQACALIKSSAASLPR